MPTSSPPATPSQEGMNPEHIKAVLIYKINAVKQVENLARDIKDELVQLFDVEQCTVYAVDREAKELYARVMLDPHLGTPADRVPITDASIAGYCARHTKVMNIADVRDIGDEGGRETQETAPRQGQRFRIRCMLAVPILFERKYLLGVLVLINKYHGGRFTPAEERLAWDVAKSLGVMLRHKPGARRSNRFASLLEQGLITPEALGEARSVARQNKTGVEAILIERYQIPKHELGQTLSRFFGRPFVDLTTPGIRQRRLMAGLSLDFLQANCWVPLWHDDGFVDIVMEDPGDQEKVNNIRLLLPGYVLRWNVGLHQDIMQYFHRIQHAPAEVAAEVTGGSDELSSPVDATLVQAIRQATGLSDTREILEASMRLFLQMKTDKDKP